MRPCRSTRVHSDDFTRHASGCAPFSQLIGGREELVLRPPPGVLRRMPRSSRSRTSRRAVSVEHLARGAQDEGRAQLGGLEQVIRVIGVSTRPSHCATLLATQDDYALALERAAPNGGPARRNTEHLGQLAGVHIRSRGLPDPCTEALTDPAPRVPARWSSSRHLASHTPRSSRRVRQRRSWPPACT